MKYVPWILVLLIVAGWLAFGQAQESEPFVRAYWLAPTTGSPVEVYQLELTTVNLAEGDTLITLYNDIPPNETGGELILPYMYGYQFTARVRGRDAQLRWGPYSEQSDPFTDHGPPGTPGRPLHTLFLQ